MMAFRCDGSRCLGGTLFPSGTLAYPCEARCQFERAEDFASEPNESASIALSQSFSWVNTEYPTEVSESQTSANPSFQYLNDEFQAANLNLGSYDRGGTLGGPSVVKTFWITYTRIDDPVQEFTVTATAGRSEFEWKKSILDSWVTAVGNPLTLTPGTDFDGITPGSGSLPIFVRFDPLFDPGQDISYTLNTKISSIVAKNEVFRNATISFGTFS